MSGGGDTVGLLSHRREEGSRDKELFCKQLPITKDDVRSEITRPFVDLDFLCLPSE